MPFKLTVENNFPKTLAEAAATPDNAAKGPLKPQNPAVFSILTIQYLDLSGVEQNATSNE